MTTSPRFPTVCLTQRLTLRRVATLVGALGAVSVLASVAGIAYVWPLFVLPLILASVFFFEIGGLVVTFWLANFFVLSYSLGAPTTEVALRQAALGTALFLIAGLLLGRVQRKNQEEHARLAASSLTDRLTGLYNYGSFLDHVHYEIAKVDRYGGELSVIMLDIDHFKAFNDKHGHETGNSLLGNVGTTLRAHMRDADIAARYGGEEFAVLIHGDEVRGFELAQRLRRAVESISLEVRGSQLASVTISAGVATYPNGSADQGQLIERSDEALYESKRRGRNRVTIHTGTPPEERAASLSA
ncbi:MAG TPA: GGDEF domain-containing protein [Thermoleophilia bacterium]|nr:GGDEF domain-containing protein [Thermoleophilia bacterium]